LAEKQQMALVVCHSVYFWLPRENLHSKTLLDQKISYFFTRRDFFLAKKKPKIFDGEKKNDLTRKEKNRFFFLLPLQGSFFCYLSSYEKKRMKFSTEQNCTVKLGYNEQLGTGHFCSL
jgi:hypothetical protein